MGGEQYEDPTITRPGEVADHLRHRGIVPGLVLTRVGNVVGHAEQAVLLVGER